MAQQLLDGRYLLADRIGAGGMGEVWRAHDQRLRREVAVKRITGLGHVQDPKAVARFVQEAQVVAGLSSRHIVTVHDIATAALDDGPELPYLVMELLHGTPLDRLLRGGGSPARLDDARRWGSQMARALATAHAAGVVHRDMKPANVLVTDGETGEDEGLVKVLDFGIARLLDAAAAPTTLTVTGAALGTPAYMSPEQIRAEPGLPVDARSDLYSLGCILYELVTGRLPFEAPSVYPLLRKHIEEPPTPPSRLRADLPMPWEDLILALLAKSPDDRPQTAGQVRDRLDELGSATPAPPPPRPAAQADAPTRTTPASPGPWPAHPPTQLDRGAAATTPGPAAHAEPAAAAPRQPTVPKPGAAPSRPPMPASRPFARSDPGASAPHRGRPQRPERQERQRAVSQPSSRRRSRLDEPLTVAAGVMVATALTVPWWVALILTVGSAAGVHLRNRNRNRPRSGSHL
ncbi:serine/threonine-protein kinase [Streptomyces sp. NPDC001537]